MRQILIVGLLLLFSVICKGESQFITGPGNDFAQRLMKTETNQKKESYIISPLAALASLGILGLGAKGKTYDTIFNNIRFPGNNSLEKNLEYLFTNISKGETNLRLKTKLRVPKNMELESDFYIKLGKIFTASISLLEGSGDDSQPPKNSRVETSLKSDVGSILSPDIKISFTGVWLQNCTVIEDIFYGYKEYKKVSTLKFVGRFLHGKVDDLKSDVVVMGYKDTHNIKYSFVIVLPREAQGLEDLLIKTNELDIKEILQTLDGVKNLTIQLPRFTIDQTYDLKQNLKDLGISHMFGKNADFSKITTSSKLHVNTFKQNVFLNVDAFGTSTSKKRAAKSKDHANHHHKKVHRKIMKSLNNHIGEAEFKVNRPFLFFLVSQQYDIVFEGTVVMPEF